MSARRSMPTKPDAVILCGGAGSRLRTVTGDNPKSMATIGHRPFLELLLRQLSRHQWKRVVLAVGYREDAIRRHFGMQAFGLEIVYSSEPKPLGTAGALRNALDCMESEAVLVMNGDSYTDVDLGQVFTEYHRDSAEVSLVLIPLNGRSDCGSVLVDADGNVKEFQEKTTHPDLEYANAGIYVIARKLIADIPPGKPVSIEHEVFPRWLREGKRMRAFLSQSSCMDIGTPERYQNAQDTLSDAERR